MSSLDQALATVDDFEAKVSWTAAWKLERNATLQRIRDLLRHPEQLHQRGLNACAPAVFFRVWFARDPMAAAKFACTLLRDGAAGIGTLWVAPSPKLLAQDYAKLRSDTDAKHPNATPESADWMLLSALRDSENVWFDYLGEPFTASDAVAGLTLPGTLAGWLSATDLYSKVENDTSVVGMADQQELLQMIPTSDLDVVLLVNARALYDLRDVQPTGQPPSPDGLALPDHYVLMTAPFAQWNGPDWTKIECWSWGRTYAGWQGTQRFFNTYFGLITARAK